MGSGISLRFGEHQFNLITLYSNTKSARQNRAAGNRVEVPLPLPPSALSEGALLQENKLFTHAGARFEVAPSIQELCRRSQAFVYVLDASKSPEESPPLLSSLIGLPISGLPVPVSASWEELSAMACPLWTPAGVPLLVLACSRGTWSPAWEGPELLPPARIAALLRLGRLNRRWLVQAGEVPTLFDW